MVMFTIFPQSLRLETGASGKPKHWSTWWILDGGDDADSLRAVDVKANLNRQVADAQANFRTCFSMDLT